MRSFQTIRELIEFVSDGENVVTLDNGEVTLTDWHKDAKALEQYVKNYRLVVNDQNEWESQRAELTQRVAELTEQLASANDELAGLKEFYIGSDSDDKKIIQRLNAAYTAAKCRIKHLEARVSVIPDLEKKVDEFNRSRIVEAVKKAAGLLNVPQNIIDDSDIMKIVVSDLTIDDWGNVVVKDDCTQTVFEFIAARQRVRPHWQPNGSVVPPMQSMSEYGAQSDGAAAIASLFSDSGSSFPSIRPANDYGARSDAEKAIAALFD
jgi:hypothetical protein